MDSFILYDTDKGTPEKLTYILDIFKNKKPTKAQLCAEDYVKFYDKYEDDGYKIRKEDLVELYSTFCTLTKERSNETFFICGKCKQLSHTLDTTKYHDEANIHYLTSVRTKRTFKDNQKVEKAMSKKLMEMNMYDAETETFDLYPYIARRKQNCLSVLPEPSRLKNFKEYKSAPARIQDKLSPLISTKQWYPEIPILTIEESKTMLPNLPPDAIIEKIVPCKESCECKNCDAKVAYCRNEHYQQSKFVNRMINIVTRQMKAFLVCLPENHADTMYKQLISQVEKEIAKNGSKRRVLKNYWREFKAKTEDVSEGVEN